MSRVPTRQGRGWDVVTVRDAGGCRGYGEASDGGSDVQGELDAVVGRTVADALLHVAAEAEHAAGLGDVGRLAALGGVETALCDLAARHAEEPLADWLAGCDVGVGQVRLYANINRTIDRPDPAEFAGVAARAVAEGFTAVKCAPFDRWDGSSERAETGLALIETVRSAIGSDVDLMVDVHFHLSSTELRRIASGLADLDLRWLEDAAPLTDLPALHLARTLVGAPIAGGEQLASVGQVSAAVRAGLCDIVMPDVKYSGGVRRALAYARGAQQLGAEISLHNPSGPVATAASAHVSRCVEATWLEFAFAELPHRATTVVPAERITNGTYLVPDRAGLGMDPLPGAGWSQTPTVHEGDR